MRWLSRNDSRIRKLIEILEQIYGCRQRRQGLDLTQVIVLTVLSQNTTDVNSRRGYFNLLKEHPPAAGVPEEIKDSGWDIRVVDSAKELPPPDWKSVRKSDQKSLESAIAPAGLQKSKAATIRAVLDWQDNLPEEPGRYLADLPEDEGIKCLTEIKGLGVKTAAVVLMETTEADVCPVDTHVNRICRRLKLVEYDGPSREKLFGELQPLIPSGEGYNLHHNLLSFGRTICKARDPRCGDCPIKQICWDRRVRKEGEELKLKFPG